MNKVLIGKKIKDLRKTKGLTQANLAELVDMHEKHISRIESGKFLPTFDNLVKIFKVLEYDISKVTEDDNEIVENQTKTKFLKIINNASEKELIFYLKIIEELQKNLRTYCS